jgi:hypothetical protein
LAVLKRTGKNTAFKRYSLYTIKDKLFVKKCQERQNVRHFISDSNSEKETRLKMEMEGKMNFISRMKQRRPCCDKSVSPGLLYTVMKIRPGVLQPKYYCEESVQKDDWSKCQRCGTVYYEACFGFLGSCKAKELNDPAISATSVYHII